MKIKKAIIPAAGLGTRFLPATKAQPKEMLPIVDKPTIQYIIEEAAAAGIEQILIITGRSKRAVEDHFDRSPELEMALQTQGKDELLREVRDISEIAEIHYVRQREPRGLGHAIYCARMFVGREPFAVLLGDDVVYAPKSPAIKQLCEIYERYGSSVLGVQRVPLDQTSKYGIVKYSGTVEKGVYRVDDLVEKPKTDPPSDVAILGRYIITPDIFEILERTDPGAGGEIQLTDALRILAKRELMCACEFEGIRYDVGDKLGFLKANIEYALRMPQLAGDLTAYIKQLEPEKFMKDE